MWFKKEEANAKNASSKIAFPEVTVEVKDKRQVFYEVKSDYELDKASLNDLEAIKLPKSDHSTLNSITTNG